MRVLIVEDEIMAQKALKRIVESRYPQMKVIACTQGVSQTVDFLKEHENDAPDVIFMDVELADGNCFEIFRQIKVTSKVIMTTAYDSYAINAFEAGSVDYLLKPINHSDLDRAVGRVLQAEHKQDIDTALGVHDAKMVKERFIVRLNDRIVPVKVDDIAFFYSEEKNNFLRTTDGKTYVTDSSLDIIAGELPQQTFFRISRSCIVSVKAIQSIVKQVNGCLLIVSDPEADFKMTVSRSRVDDFMQWIAR